MRLTKAGLLLPLEPKVWKESHYLSATFGKPLGFEQIFVPAVHQGSEPPKQWRAIRVDFQSDSNPKQKQLSELCPAKGVTKLPRVKGFECVYRLPENSNGQKYVIAVKKVRREFRAPASKKFLEFTRYVTFVEQSDGSTAGFISWISKAKEIK